MIVTDLKMVGGLPYNRRIRVVGGTKIWPIFDDFEVRSQIRVSADEKSTLKALLTPFLTSSIDGEDIVIDMDLKGSDTRNVPSGYYDIVVSDKGNADIRAIRVLGGKLSVKPLVTGG